MKNARFEARLTALRNRYVLSLPERVAAIAATLREREGRDGRSETLDRQFHNLAGTAGTFGLFAIAATAMDGYDECSDLEGKLMDADARYLWSIVEELENAIGTPAHIFDTLGRLRDSELLTFHAA